MTTVLLPFVLLTPLVLLLALLVEVGSYGPVGWAADVLILLATAWGTRAAWRAGRRWWASTKAPVKPPSGWF